MASRPETEPKTNPTKTQASPLREVRALWPELKALIRPRRGLLAAGLLLIGINRPGPARVHEVSDRPAGERKEEHHLAPP